MANPMRMGTSDSRMWISESCQASPRWVKRYRISPLPGTALPIQRDEHVIPPAAQQTAQGEKQARKQQLKAANTGNAQGSGEGTRRKIYRRADIIKLMRTDPERYQAISAEILAAYAEGRVK